MTKKDRTERILALVAEAFAPEPGDGRLHIKVHAATKDNLFVEGLHDNGPGKQFYFRFDLTAPDIVREMHGAMLTAAGQDVIPL